MKNLLKVLKVYYGFLFRLRWWFCLFVVVAMARSVSNSILPYFFKFFIDSIPKFDFQLLMKILIGYIGVRFLSLLLSNLSEILGDMVLVEGSTYARSRIFKHIQDLDFAFHASKSTGSLISIFKRGDGAFFSMFEALNRRIFDVSVGFIVMSVVFWQLDWKITAIAVVTFIVTIPIAKLVIDRNVKTRETFNEEDDKLSAVMVDNLINYETVKLFAKEKWEIKRLDASLASWKSKLWNYFLTFRIIDVSVGILINLSVFLLLYYSLGQVTSLDLTIGELVLVMAFINTFYPQIWDLVWSFRDIAKNFTDIEKYFGLLDYEILIKDPEIPVETNAVSGKINFDNVSFSYAEARRNAVRNLTLSVKPGQSIALVGRSGSGKTTLMKLLMRFYDVNSGQISVDGINIKNFTKSRLRSFMGVVPQEPILFNNTIGYNIGYGKENAEFNEVKLAAKMANLDQFIDGLPQKYDTHVGERGIKLSGGQKQRLAIARMILSNPDIIIFDEATSQLDSENEKLIQDAFWKVAKGKTTFIIAHRLSTAKRADVIVVMQDGRIKEIDTHKKLLGRQNGLYKYFWDLQTKD